MLVNRCMYTCINLYYYVFWPYHFVKMYMLSIFLLYSLCHHYVLESQVNFLFLFNYWQGGNSFNKVGTVLKVSQLFGLLITLYTS